MPTVNIVTATYELCLGTDVSDASPTVIGVAFTSRAAAEAVRDEYLRRQTAGDLSSAAVSGKTFYVRAASGTLAVTGVGTLPTGDEAVSALTLGGVTVPLYIKTDAGDYVEVASLPAATIATLA